MVSYWIHKEPEPAQPRKLTSPYSRGVNEMTQMIDDTGENFSQCWKFLRLLLTVGRVLGLKQSPMEGPRQSLVLVQGYWVKGARFLNVLELRAYENVIFGTF